MTDENKPQESKVNIKWVKSSEGVFETYANQTNINWSLDDVRLRFAEIGPGNDAGPGEKLISVYVEKAAITLTWRNAKVLVNGLSRIIGNYEKVNGEINLKPELASNEGT